MKKLFLFQVISLLLLGCVYGQSSLNLPASLEGEIPWDLENLKNAPAYRWEDQKDSVWSLIYEGEKFEGELTEVFAYYASPKTIGSALQEDGGYPAVVLVHGGGGTAFHVWVMEWAKRGYAAIAMDLGGSRPLSPQEQEGLWGQKTHRLAHGGPYQDDVHKFFRLDEGFNEQWQFHAVSNIIRAHSLIRSLEEVDQERTALTGISWGGYLTILASGIDHRFKAAVPVYGAGFLHEGSAWDPQFDSLGREGTQNWVRLWDPSRYVSHAKMPMLFINGTNDFAYFVENWHKTAGLAQNRYLSLIPGLKHSHAHGAEPQEIFNFIDAHLGAGFPFPSLGKAERQAGKIRSPLNLEPSGIKEIYLVYTEEEKRSPERKWEMVKLRGGGYTIEANIPKEARLCYLYLLDKEGNRISGEVIAVR